MRQSALLHLHLLSLSLLEACLHGAGVVVGVAAAGDIWVLCTARPCNPPGTHPHPPHREPSNNHAARFVLSLTASAARRAGRKAHPLALAANTVSVRLPWVCAI